MDEEVIRNDTTFISTSLAAELSGYSRDYIGQLARDGYFDSTKVGRKRFVDRKEFIAYALDNKTDLSASDLPKNHLPDDWENRPKTSNKESAETESDTAESDDDFEDESSSGSLAEVNDSSQVSVETKQDATVIADPTHFEPNSFQTQPHNQPVTDRMSSRWRNRRDQRPQEFSDRNDKDIGGQIKAAVFALAFVLVVSAGLVFSTAESVQNTATRIATNMTVAAERAYEGVGFGLQKKLAAKSAPTVIASSLVETADLVADAGRNFQQQLGDRLSQTLRKSQSGQGHMAAVTTANIVTETMAFVGEGVRSQMGWLTSAGSTKAFRHDGNYFADQTTRLVQAEIRPDQEAVLRNDTGAVQTDITDNRSDERPSTTTIDAANQGEKAVVVPAPTSSAARRRTEQEIRKQFSDPVDISTSSSNSGVIQPQFADRSGDEYLYIMVPSSKK